MISPTYGPDLELMKSLTNGKFVESACSSDTHSIYTLGKCHWAGKTPFCDAVIAESPVYGNVLFIDNELQSASADEAIYHEHLVHPVMTAMAQFQNKKVLIVGGGEGATAREVLKWPVEQVSEVYWIDIDGDLVDMCRRHLRWADDSVYNDKRLHFHAMDIRLFLERFKSQFDIIILDLPDPDVDTLMAAESITDDDYTLYGKRFWYSIQHHLVPNGAVVSHVGPISPGADESARRSGLKWVRESAINAGLGEGYPYHVCIPSFQGEWGFWMSVRPHESPNFPNGLRVMDSAVLNYAFTWPKYWETL